MHKFQLSLLMVFLTVLTSGCEGGFKETGRDPLEATYTTQIPNCFSGESKPLELGRKEAYVNCNAVEISYSGEGSIPLKDIRVQLASRYGYTSTSCYSTELENTVATTVSPNTILEITYTLNETWAKGILYKKNFGNKETVGTYRILANVKATDVIAEEKLCP